MAHTTIAQFLPLDKPLIIFDLETTGLTPGEDKIVEIAYEKILPSGEVVAYCQRINPGKPISPDASRINGIYDKDVASAPSFAKLSYELWSMFEGADVGGFNIIGFDLPFLKGEFALVGKNFDFTAKRILDAKILYHKMEAREMFGRRWRFLRNNWRNIRSSGTGTIWQTCMATKNCLNQPKLSMLCWPMSNRLGRCFKKLTTYD